MIKNGLQVFEEFKKELIATKDENFKRCAYALFKALEKSIVEDGQHQYFLELNDQSNQKEVYDLIKRIVERESTV